MNSVDSRTSPAKSVNKTTNKGSDCVVMVIEVMCFFNSLIEKIINIKSANV